MIPKFRAYDKETGSMRDVLVIDYLNGDVDLSGGLIERSFQDVVLMQSTCLRDKNGVEIFEGDIAETRQSDLSSVSYEMVGGVVTYDSDNGMFKLVRKYGSKFHSFTIWLDNVEVIGNVWENPNLLKGGRLKDESDR